MPLGGLLLVVLLPRWRLVVLVVVVRPPCMLLWHPPLPPALIQVHTLQPSPTSTSNPLVLVTTAGTKTCEPDTPTVVVSANDIGVVVRGGVVLHFAIGTGESSVFLTSCESTCERVCVRVRVCVCVCVSVCVNVCWCQYESVHARTCV